MGLWCLSRSFGGLDSFTLDAATNTTHRSAEGGDQPSSTASRRASGAGQN